MKKPTIKAIAKQSGSKTAKPDKQPRFAKLKPSATASDASRRHRQAGRLAEILRILELLQGRGRYNVKEIAQEIGRGERTVYRHFNSLRAFGIMVEYDPVFESYKIQGNCYFPAVNLTDEEALGQATATAITHANGLNIGDAGPVTRKLAVKADDQIAQILDDGERLFMVMGLQLANHREHREIIRTAQWALLKGRKLVGVYRSPYKDSPQQLQLSPWRICLIKQSWYLIARPDDGKDAKTYRLARFSKLRMTNATAIRPPDFDVRAYFGDAWAVYRGDQKYDIEILFTPDAAGLVSETEWHHTQKVTKHKDGSATLIFQVDGLNEIVHWILGWSNRAKVIRPPELRKMVKEHLDRASSQY